MVPAENGPEAALVEGIDVLCLPTACASSPVWPPASGCRSGPSRCRCPSSPAAGPDLADLRGQRHLRHALEVAAAGGHSLLMVGPPGAGKSLAASRLPSILPPLATEEALEVARIASACGRLAIGGPGGRPFRAPHHTVSPAGLVGGGNPPRRRRGDPGPPRSSLPRRALRVPPRHAGGAAGAVGDGLGLDRAGGIVAAPALPLHARRSGQSLSLRPRRGRPRVQLRAARGAPLPGPSQRGAGRSHRPARRGPPAECRGDGRRRPASPRRGPRAGRGRSRAPGTPPRSRALQRRDDPGRAARVPRSTTRPRRCSPIPTRGAGSAAAPTTASCDWRRPSPTWPAPRRSAASRWRRPCSCGRRDS